MPSVSATKFALASLIVAGAAVAGAAAAAADPAPTEPVPIDPAVVPPPPVAAPMVPEVSNPVYGSGRNDSGPLGSLRDLWHQARDPYYTMEDPGRVPGGAPPPPGAGPAPALPPGFVSINAPGSETAAPSTGPKTGGPALPPGYYPLDGPPPPGYEYGTPPAPSQAAAPAPVS